MKYFQSDTAIAAAAIRVLYQRAEFNYETVYRVGGYGSTVGSTEIQNSRGFLRVAVETQIYNCPFRWLTFLEYRNDGLLRASPLLTNLIYDSRKSRYVDFFDNYLPLELLGKIGLFGGRTSTSLY